MGGIGLADGAEEHVVHEQSPKRGPASKKKPKRKKKAAHSEDPSDGTSGSADWHRNSKEIEESESEEEDNDDEKSEGEKSESKGDDEDPDEEVTIPADSYVVVSIRAHKLMCDGTTKYLISWKDTDVTTWEPSSSITRQLRSDYHKNHQAMEEAAAAAEVAQRSRFGRRRRVYQSDEAKAVEKKWVDKWAADAVLRGVDHWVAHDDAVQAYANRIL